MTISTTRPEARRRAFTLVEVMIGAALGSVVLAGVMSTFLMLARSGVSAVNYTTMDTQSRRALEEFAQDVRMASDVTAFTSSYITLVVPDNYTSTANKVTYAWDNTAGSASYRCFYRVPGDSATGTPKTIYIRNVTSFSFARFDRLNATTTSNTSTKRVQISMTVTSTARTVVNTTDQLVSASFILRNKAAS
jgi:type IV pilus assembly protein PilW